MPGNDGVAPEMGRVVVAFVQRMSDDRPLAASNPFAQQRGLTKAGWGEDEGELAIQTPVLVVQDKCRVQPLDQARARHQLWSGGGGYGAWFSGDAWSFRFFSLHQHLQLTSSPDCLPLPMVVHVDQRQWRFLVQLTDLGYPFLQFFVAVAIVVPLPGLVVAPPCLVVVNANHKRRLS